MSLCAPSCASDGEATRRRASDSRGTKSRGSIAEMTSTTDLAALWERNKTVVDRWMDDYCARQGKTREDVIAKRKGSWFHDSSAEKIGMHHGYELSVICMGGNCWRYTVVTPWGMNEGLADLEPRDDAAAIARLAEVDAKMNERRHEDGQEPTKEEKTPPRASERTTEVSEVALMPTAKRGRGRPRGSKDRRPRKRRAKAEIVPNTAAANELPRRDKRWGLIPYDKNVAWVPNGDGVYEGYDIWLGGKYPQIIVSGEPRMIPRGAFVWPKGKKMVMDGEYVFKGTETS